ncbi:uncharacterized protein LY89DRAFT_676041 [Mollisia scopiformis]|uniref:SnoaL-like domain-containing protein n=1 Tax=Mollisia scopiformis TaxID=149040 RepID=A0A132BAE9_MOLSC|nr:uncharacterized protein LY89DRAFT_676041 [Mollisia scopiformis]KUJ09223.1 hypothetical protein LY89DRAFT_676041 [Mollisia scopiformis]
MSAHRDLKAPTLEFLDLFCNKKDIEKSVTYLHPEFTATHDDWAPKDLDGFIEQWKHLITSLWPEFKYEAIDTVQEGNKVWVYARITGLQNGEAKDSIDMLEWDKEGEKIIKTKDVQRTVEHHVHKNEIVWKMRPYPANMKEALSMKEYQLESNRVFMLLETWRRQERSIGVIIESKEQQQKKQEHNPSISDNKNHSILQPKHQKTSTDPNTEMTGH